jgi:hypothetical protein
MALRPESATLVAEHRTIALARIVAMRFALILLATISLTAPTMAQSREACEMVPKAVLEALLGANPTIDETQGQGTGMSLCAWRGADKKIVVTSITAESQQITGGTPLDYFNQYADDRKATYPDIVHDLPGIWQAGYIWDFEEPNPENVVTLSYLNKDDTVTLNTFGLGREASIALATAIAEAM